MKKMIPTIKEVEKGETKRATIGGGLPAAHVHIWPPFQPPLALQ